MIKIKAQITLYSGKYKRQSPFKDGYRPTFSFIEISRTSGHISLLDRNLFYPNDTGIVEITFLNRDLLGDNFNVGTKFHFYESEEPLGEGEVLEIL